MTNTINQVIAYARAHPTRDGGTWHNWCESFIWRAGGFDGSFDSAQLAGDASGWLNPDWAAAPAGAMHYWSGAGDGHDAFSLGNGLALMASNGVTNSWGDAIGTATIPDYNRNKPVMKYRGWSMRHGSQTLSGTSPTTLQETPIIIKKKDEIPMARYIRNRDTQTIAWANPDTGLWEELANTDYVALCDGLGVWDRSKDLDIPDNQYNFLKATAAKVRGTNIDTPALIAAVVTALGSQVSGSVNIPQLAAAVDAALVDNFAAVPDAVRLNIKTNL